MILSAAHGNILVTCIASILWIWQYISELNSTYNFLNAALFITCSQYTCMHQAHTYKLYIYICDGTNWMQIDHLSGPIGIKSIYNVSIRKRLCLIQMIRMDVSLRGVGQ